MTMLETPVKVYSSLIRVDADDMVHVYANGEYFVTHISCDLRTIVQAKAHILNTLLIDNLNNTWDFVHKVEKNMPQEVAFENRREILVLDDHVMFVDKMKEYEDCYCLSFQDSFDFSHCEDALSDNSQAITQQIHDVINNWHINRNLNLSL